MSGNRIVLDTNAVITLIVGEEPLKRIVRRYENLLLPVIVIGELVYGAEKSAKPELNFERIRLFKSGCEVLAVNEATAHRFGVTRNLLRSKGKPIPDNDLWIAALAMEHEVPVLTRDRHFQSVDGLQTVTW